MMTWGEFRELFKGKFFPTSARHANVKPRKKLEIFTNGKMIIIIINCHNGSGKPRKLSRSRMTKRTALLNSSREI